MKIHVNIHSGKFTMYSILNDRLSIIESSYIKKIILLKTYINIFDDTVNWGGRTSYREFFAISKFSPKHVDTIIKYMIYYISLFTK